MATIPTARGFASGDAPPVRFLELPPDLVKHLAEASTVTVGSRRVTKVALETR